MYHPRKRLSANAVNTQNKTRASGCGLGLRCEVRAIGQDHVCTQLSEPWFEALPADHVDCLYASLRRELDQILTHSGIRGALDDPVPFLQILNASKQHMGRERVNHGHRQLLGTPSGRFEETGEAAGIAQDTRGRGAVIEDFNADGQLDLLVVNREAQPGLFRNLGPAGASTATQRLGNFLRVELDNGAVNPDAIGAMVSVKTGNRYQTQTVAIGGGHASGQLGFVHFGLGLADLAEVRVKWPDSGWSAPYQVYANSHVVISRDETNVLLWYPVD